jgi:hypothetical protein
MPEGVQLMFALNPVSWIPQLCTGAVCVTHDLFAGRSAEIPVQFEDMLTVTPQSGPLQEQEPVGLAQLHDWASQVLVSVKDSETTLFSL